MAGIKHLKDFYDKEGYDSIMKLFSNEVYITEKIDASRFVFERFSDKIQYFKRDSKTPINLIDRTVMQFYESAINHIESLDIDRIPIGVRFGFEYFTSKTPGSIVYDLLPVNNLILTDIYNNGEFDTNIISLCDHSDILKVTPPPMIYKGKLSESQKTKLIEFLETDWNDLFVKFNTESFTSYTMSILNPFRNNTTLNIGIDKPIEGFVFSFNVWGSFIHGKLIDPLYTKKSRELAKARHTPEKKENDLILQDVITELITFTKSNIDNNIKYKTSNTDERYVELLSSIFKEYCLKYKSKFNKVVINNSINNNKLFDVNYTFIFDEELRCILKSNEKIKYAFKIFLNTFGKLRKRSTSILSKSMITDINTLIIKLKKLS